MELTLILAEKTRPQAQAYAESFWGTFQKRWIQLFLNRPNDIITWGFGH